MLSKPFSLILLICLSPLFIIVALIIILDDGFPILFRQKRVGLNNTHFWIYKFRTMKKDAPDIPTHLVKDDASLYTSFGPLLRKFSLDELPQLINIVKGDMAFIGPRPALYNQDDLIELRTQAGVHSLMPGVTGWAQVNGRDELPVPEKVALDVEYMERQSLWFDIYILWLTVLKVLVRDGISH